LLFEAGAIATGFDLRRVYPLVIDFTVDDLKGPLSQFQGVKCDRNGITMIIESLNKELNAEALTKFDLHTKLEKYWEGFNRKISGDWISWDEYWEKQSAVVDVLRRMMIDNIYTPDLLVGISNGGLHFADTILRRVYDNSKPLLCLWANRNNEKSYFDNDLNNSFFEGNFVNNLLGKNDKMNRELEILILDDVVGSSKTFQQVSEYLNIKFGESFEFCRFSFIFLYTIEDDIYDVMKPQLLTMYDNCRKYFDEIRFKHNTNKSKLPYLKDIRSGGVIRND
jgi:hypoxanthine phosphoribosyltransferase